MLVDVFVVLGSLAALIPALQAIGIDTRLFGRGTPMSAEVSGQQPIAKWRWWLVLIFATLAQEAPVRVD